MDGSAGWLGGWGWRPRPSTDAATPPLVSDSLGLPEASTICDDLEDVTPPDFTLAVVSPLPALLEDCLEWKM